MKPTGRVRRPTIVGWPVRVAVAAAALTVGCSSVARPHGGAAVPDASPASAIASSAPASAAPSAVGTGPVSTAFPQATTVRESTQINGALVAADGQQLSINYVGGACDASARATTDETPTSITVHVLVTLREAACPAIGYSRVVTAELKSPWAHRSIVDITDAEVPTVDGTLLLSPGWVPAGYERGQTIVGESDDKTSAGTSWTMPMAPPPPSACQPGPSGFQLIQGYGISASESIVPGTYLLSDGTPLVVYADNGQFEMHWTPPNHPAGWSVDLHVTTSCQGDTLLTLPTMMEIANSLH